MRYPGENSAGRAPGRRQGPSGRTGPPEERAAGGAAASRKAARGDASLFAPGYSGGRAAAREPVPVGGGRYGGGGAAGKGPIRGFPPGPGQPPPVYPPGPFSAWNRTSGEAGNGYDPEAGDAWLAAGLAGAVAAAYAPGETGYGDAGYSDAGYADTGYADTGYADAGYADAGHADPAAPEPFASGQPEPGYADPGYSALAVSDPAADVTSTQSWDVVDDASPASHWPEVAAAGDRWSQAPGATATPPAGLARPDLDRPGQPDGPDPAGGPPGPFDRAAPAPFDRGSTGPSARVAAAAGQRAATGPGRAAGGHGRGTRGRSRPGGRGRRLRTLLICGLALIVVAGATYAWFARGGSHRTTAAGTNRPTARPSADPSPTPSLGPWGHIVSRALDPTPLTLTELFPASFSSAGITYVRTVDKAKAHCAPALVGSGLVSAVNAAGCTQAMRASYLASNRKVMGTIGVLNLATTTAAEKAGKAAGPTEFIAQLPAVHGLTRFLTKGTGIEAAEVKGHYLVLVWAELGTTHAPATAAQRTEIDDFISLLMQQTANISLASRMVTGTPAP
jgi:hypothetical protein